MFFYSVDKKGAKVFKQTHLLFLSTKEIIYNTLIKSSCKFKIVSQKLRNTMNNNNFQEIRVDNG